MLDLKLFENNIEESKAKLFRRGEVLGLDKLSILLSERKSLTIKVQAEQEKLNIASKELQSASKNEIAGKREELRKLSHAIKEKQSLLRDLEADVEEVALAIPNIPQDDVPDGSDESDNLEIKKVLKPREFNFKIKLSWF